MVCVWGLGVGWEHVCVGVHMNADGRPIESIRSFADAIKGNESQEVGTGN